MHDAVLQLQSRAYSTSEITEVEVAAGAASVSVEARLWPHMEHVFQALPLPQAVAAESASARVHQPSPRMARRRSASVLALLAAALVLPLAAQETRLQGRVVRVDSGDQLMLAVDGREISVRLSDIGAPQGAQFYAPAAQALLEGIVRGRKVELEITGRSDGDDRVFGRVRTGELDVNLELVRRGAAWVCWEYSPNTDYLPWEKQAQRLRLGLWSRTLEINALSACRERPPAVRPLFPRN